MNYKEIGDLIKFPKKIIVTMHSRPDADALGSSLALSSVLNKLGHEVVVISPNEYPKFLDWFKDSSEVLIYSVDPKKCNSLIQNADLIFCLDFSSLNRLDIMAKVIETATNALKIVIDHHINPQKFYDYLIWDTNASATAILVYRLLKNLHLLNHISPDVADCLYSGILTDTGSFQHPTTTKEAHLVTADLIAYGANISEVSRKIFNTNSINRLMFTGFAISHRLKILEDYHAAYFIVKKKDWNSFKLETGDTEGLVNYALSLENIYFGALISEQDNYIRISLRSQGNIKVNEIASKYFNGGGHKNAAGGKSFESLEKTAEKLENVIMNSEIFANQNGI